MPTLVRLSLVFLFFALLLIVVPTVFAQDNTDDSTSENIDKELLELYAPLLAGAVIVERLLEAFFTWIERGTISFSKEFTSSANWMFRWVSTFMGTLRTMIDSTEPMQIRLKQRWEAFNHENSQLAKLLLDGKASQEQLELLTQKVEELKGYYEKEVKAVEAYFGSPSYGIQKKKVATLAGLILGIFTAISLDLTLIAPVHNLPSLKLGDFDLIEGLDIVLAGMIMGLGTDYIHQFLGLVTSGRSFLQRTDMSDLIKDLKQEILTEVANPNLNK